MTEQEWVECKDPQSMLVFLRGRASDRKLRLFAVACFQQAWSEIGDRRLPSCIDLAERFANGAATAQDLDEVCGRFGAGCHEKIVGDWEMAMTMLLTPFDDPIEVPLEVCELAKAHLGNAGATLLRHLLGNPFRPYPAPASWPSTVVQLAESLYTGQDCCFALHDALLEAGHAELAEHFRQEKWHPKGCWALDVILGKK
jgi:hypothetical protein